MKIEGDIAKQKDYAILQVVLRDFINSEVAINNHTLLKVPGNHWKFSLRKRTGQTA